MRCRGSAGTEITSLGPTLHPTGVRSGEGGGLLADTGLDLLPGAPGTPVLGLFAPRLQSISCPYIQIDLMPIPLELPPAPGDPDKMPDVEAGATFHPYNSSCICPVSSPLTSSFSLPWVLAPRGWAILWDHCHFCRELDCSFQTPKLM